MQTMRARVVQQGPGRAIAANVLHVHSKYPRHRHLSLPSSYIWYTTFFCCFYSLHSGARGVAQRQRQASLGVAGTAARHAGAGGDGERKRQDRSGAQRQRRGSLGVAEMAAGPRESEGGGGCRRGKQGGRATEKDGRAWGLDPRARLVVPGRSRARAGTF